MKYSAACTNVRSVLRTVFHDLDFLPPLSVGNKSVEKNDVSAVLRGQKLRDVDNWPEKYETECIEICNRENEIKYQYGKRISLEPLPNIFKLHESKADKSLQTCRLDQDLLLRRKDLIPGIEHNAGGNDNLWIKNILNASSCDVSRAQCTTDPGITLIASDSSKETTLQTLSIGQVMPRSVPKAPPISTSPVSVEYVICVPAELHFLNCSIGRLYVKHIRLINVSKFEWRLSISPPKSNEFKVVINSHRGLTMTSGANVDLSVQFTPTDVRMLTDTLTVRVSCGQVFIIPITCYMQPPVLEILIPIANSSLTSTSERVSFVCFRNDLNFDDKVLELGARLLGDVHCSLVLLRCDAEHVKFFILTEDAWIDWNVNDHEKDYDICSDDDPGCEYYIHLGTTFPHRSLSITVKLINRSPIMYNFYWDARRWGICSCWEEELESENSLKSDDNSERLCPGAIESKHMSREDPEAYARKIEPHHVVRVEPSQDQILPGATFLLEVSVPDVGKQLGVQRHVLRLMLKDIPKESLPANYKPIILKTTEVTSTPIPGLQSSVMEVCDILVAEMEVWWEVVPVRFVLEPPVIPMNYSRRLTSVNVTLGAWQLFGRHRVRVSWVTPMRVVKPLSLRITTTNCVTTGFKLPLPSLLNQYPETDVFTLVAEKNEWKAHCAVTYQCDTRHPALRPAQTWLGIVTPRTHMQSVFSLTNNTYQKIRFWCKAFRWCGENPPSPPCVGRIPCRHCKEIACTCALLRPGQGALSQGESADIVYDVNAPQRDGCVATLLQVRRCEADLSLLHAAPATEARAALVAYRVLAPRLVLRLIPCGGTGAKCRLDCELDAGELKSELGTSTLRPSKALVVGRRTCYRLRVTNITPLPTTVRFDEPIDGTEFLKAKFFPKVFNLRSYGEVVIRVVLTAVRVCERRLFVHRAEVAHTNKPLYVVIDAAVGREEHGSRKRRLSTPQQIFIEEDQKREFVKANICHCHTEMKYIPPAKKQSLPLRDGEATPIEIVTEPPPLTRLCRCFPHSQPFMRDTPESISLEFINVPLRQDKWADEVCESGVALACCPASGTLASRAQVELRVQVYADCWGLYRDQILIQVKDVDPIVLDVWIHVEGPALQFKIQPNYTPQDLPTMWLSQSDATRSLIVKNVSRCELLVSAYVTLENECVQDVLPFRLYIRLYDVLPKTCPCDTANQSEFGEQSITPTNSSVDMDTEVELYLAADRGPQNELYYNVTPDVCTMKAGVTMKWELSLKPPSSPETAPNGTLILRLRPLHKFGDSWYRDEPAPQLVQLRQVVTVPQVKLSCDEIVVKVCALDLPYGDFLRIRKRFQVLNVGNADLNVSIQTRFPWCLVKGRPSHHDKEVRCAIGCETLPRNECRDSHVTINLPPRSSTEVCLEVSICTTEAWAHCAAAGNEACEPPCYEPRRQETSLLFVYDDAQMLFTIPLILELEYPAIKTEPQVMDFGFVTDGDSRKSYVSISHTSSKTLTLAVRWLGPPEFEIWPFFLEVPPEDSKQVYIQYTAVWRQGRAEGCVLVNVCCGAGDTRHDKSAPPSGWCRAALAVRATPARDNTWHAPPHDYTDDDHLLPKSAQAYLP
ncbi:unnamed protein product [Arctia plantaginis]|uniref:Uncharacterized protein n=1 Tax=Arctia plantaginis TaxID=874455 RepID=A0A8S0YPS7_ARCPL|nr:unnamed protein product [Arctia plantaginis]